MPANVSEASFASPDGSIEGTPTRDSVVKVTPIETVHATADDPHPIEFDVSGGPETVIQQEEPDTTPIEDIPISDISDLIKAIKKRYGKKFETWEPETLFIVLQDDLKDDLSDELKERILAARAYAADGPWTHYEEFEKAAIKTTGGVVRPNTIQYISPEDLARAIKLMKDLGPKREMSDEVLRYIAARLYEANIMWTGDVFPIECQKYIHDLGASEPLVNSCIERYKELSGLPMKKINLNENLIDIQVGRILGIKYLVDND